MTSPARLPVLLFLAVAATAMAAVGALSSDPRAGACVTGAGCWPENGDVAWSPAASAAGAADDCCPGGCQLCGAPCCSGGTAVASAASPLPGISPMTTLAAPAALAPLEPQHDRIDPPPRS